MQIPLGDRTVIKQQPDVTSCYPENRGSKRRHGGCNEKCFIEVKVTTKGTFAEVKQQNTNLKFKQKVTLEDEEKKRSLSKKKVSQGGNLRRVRW